MLFRLSFLIIFAFGFLNVSTVHAQCANPVGAEGDMVYNDSEYVMQWCDGTNWNGVGQSPYIPNAVTFDGTNDYLARNGALTGVSDSKLWTVSFWVRRNADIRTQIYDGGGGGEITLTLYEPIDSLRIQAENASGTVILNAETMANVLEPGEWHHVLISLDMSDTNKRHVYIDDVDVSSAWTTYTDDLIAFGLTQHLVTDSAAFKHNGDLADFWMDTDTYIDLSVTANRRQFIDANGWPVDLGADGSKPTGTAPDIFLSGDTATWHTNKGTGGGFTENGALTDAGSHPAAYFGPLDGLIAWWKLDETAGATAFDSSGNGYDGTLQNITLPARSRNGVISNSMYFLKPAAGFSAERVFSATGFPTGVDPSFTISMWLNVERSEGNFFTVGSDSASTEMLIRSDGNGSFLRIEMPGNSYNYFSFPFLQNKGEWYLVTLTYDGTELKLYSNDTLFNTKTPVSFTITQSAFSIGARYGGSSFLQHTGMRDDFRLYDRDLSAAEVAELYDAGYPCKNPEAQRDGTMAYNTTDNVPQYCNLREWKSMAPTPGDGGAGCANPTGEAGDVVYNSTSSVMQYCEGDTWRAIGQY